MHLLSASGRKNQYKNDQTDNSPISDEFHCTSLSLNCAFLRFQLRGQSGQSIHFSSLYARGFVNISFGNRFIPRLRILTGTLGIDFCLFG